MREREAHRIAVRQDVNGGRERRIRELQHQMKQREAMIARAKAQKQRDRELRREDEMLRQQDRLEAVERMRRMADYKKMMTIKKIREDEERTRKVRHSTMSSIAARHGPHILSASIGLSIRLSPHLHATHPPVSHSNSIQNSLYAIEYIFILTLPIPHIQTALTPYHGIPPTMLICEPTAFRRLSSNCWIAPSETSV